MSKIAHYLQDHLTGEVMTSADARRYFATDGSIFTLLPLMVVYPQNENDIRKTARFTWQLAERGRVIPITARGSGTDQSGAALGTGIVMAMPAHMNRIIEFDNKTGVVVVEPGINYGRLQQTLHTHGRFLPPFPASYEYCTIGGAVANNSSGEKTVKYGATLDYVRSLRVVLANGEVIETYRLSKKELSKKLGLATFEGEIYRALDGLLEEHKQVLDDLILSVSKNVAGYNLLDIKRRDGTFDLTPLFVGSQGTLGIVSEVTLETEVHNPVTTLFVASFDSMDAAQTAVLELKRHDSAPSAIEMVDEHLLQLVQQANPNQLKDVIEMPFPKVVLLVECDENSDRARKKTSKQVRKVLEQTAAKLIEETDPLKQEKLWKIRHASAAVVAHSVGAKKAVPIIEDGVVPLNRFKEYVDGVYSIFAKNHLQVALWGHAGDANLHMQPFLDLSQIGDRQLAFRIMDEYYSLVLSLGGSTSGEHNDGRLRGPYLDKVYGHDAYELFLKVKKICDPYGTLNPGVKVGVTMEDLKGMVRTHYSMEHLYDHLPRS
ncbi:MAG TPA: FAD-binding oxidoreductase [Candidatus Saccharimonadales bacterium]|jgi:FAD/FMN-containing dehydrogenase